MGARSVTARATEKDEMVRRVIANTTGRVSKGSKTRPVENQRVLTHRSQSWGSKIGGLQVTCVNRSKVKFQYAG